MNVTHSAAGRSRNVDSARAFFSVPANLDITGEPTPSASVPGWKWSLHLRIWTGEGPKGSAARSVLGVLLWNSDGQGRTWLGIPAITSKAGLGNERTARKALERLTAGGWITQTPQTWSSLTAEQLAVGRKVPRRGDVGQAPNLYTVLASPSRKVTPGLPTRPDFTRTTGSPVEETQGQICRGGREQIDQGEPVANLPPDPYPVGSISRMESEEGASPAPNTHLFSQAQGSQEGGAWLVAWNVLVHAHAEKTKTVYDVAPLPPDLKRDARQAVAECLDGTALDLAAKLRERGMERELVQVRQDLAARVMTLYFKRDNEHLRRVKHALRDLPREFHARIIEAKQLILRESHDEAKSLRQTVVLELEQTARPKVEKAAEVAKIEATEKPIPEAMPANTAREARRIIEALSATPSREEPSKPRKAEPTPRPTKAKLAEGHVAEGKPEQARTEPQRPGNDRATASQTVQRSIGRPGAPRWGALGPTPAKVRRVSRLQVAEVEDATENAEPHPRE